MRLFVAVPLSPELAHRTASFVDTLRSRVVRLAPHTRLSWVPPERLHIGGHAAYLHCAGGILESKAGSALLGKLGREVTTRNWATVLKLKALLGSGVA